MFSVSVYLTDTTASWYHGLMSKKTLQSLEEIRRKRAEAVRQLAEASSDLAHIQKDNPEAAQRIQTMLVDAALSGPGLPITVRVHRDLLARLDTYRGGKTRPQAIRALLEEYLP